MIRKCLCDLSLCLGDSLLGFLGLVLSLSHLGQVLEKDWFAKTNEGKPMKAAPVDYEPV